jgi:hypothetical protein
MEKKVNDTLSLLRAVRKNILTIFEAHSLEQLNTIPAGFGNNMVWNAGHVVATMELLVYGLAGLKTPSGREFIDRYRKGSRPEGPVDQAECDLIAARLTEGIDHLETDLAHEDFSHYQEYTTSFGVSLSSVEDALVFNNMHEAMHLGTMLALRGSLK